MPVIEAVGLRRTYRTSTGVVRRKRTWPSSVGTTS
jgi:hypothetical protein